MEDYLIDIKLMVGYCQLQGAEETCTSYRKFHWENDNTYSLKQPDLYVCISENERESVPEIQAAIKIEILYMQKRYRIL